MRLDLVEHIKTFSFQLPEYKDFYIDIVLNESLETVEYYLYNTEATVKQFLFRLPGGSFVFMDKHIMLIEQYLDSEDCIEAYRNKYM